MDSNQRKNWTTLKKDNLKRNQDGPQTSNTIDKKKDILIIIKTIPI